MYQLIRSLSTQALVLRQFPVIVISFLVAGFFFKFGSFFLETLAFLALWAVLDAVVSLWDRLRRQPVHQDTSASDG